MLNGKAANTVLML